MGEKAGEMRLLFKILIIVFVVLVPACSSGERKNKKQKLIASRDLVPLLTDIYIANGLLSNPPFKDMFALKDSILNYTDVIGKHGYTKEQVDNTLRYYFTGNPKKLQKIYDRVLAQLTEIESEIESNSATKKLLNLWNQKSNFSLPEEGVHNPLFFSIPIKDTGLYTLSFDCTLFEDDHSLNPVTTIYFWHSDGTEQGVKTPWNKILLIRDGVMHNYSITKRLTDISFTHIRGYLHDCDSQTISWVKHSKFSNILIYQGKAE